jgi:hypothetical protein
MTEFVVASEDSPRNWLHCADIVLADAETAAAAACLAEELVRRYPGCLIACVVIRGGER